MLLLTAAIWGFAFVAQSVGMDYLGPFTFNAVRSLIGGITLLPFIALSVRKKMEKRRREAGRCGSAACAAEYFCLQPAVCSRSGFSIQLRARRDLSRRVISCSFRYSVFC